MPVSRPSQYSFHASLASHLVALLLSHYRLMMILIGDLNNGDHHRHVDDDHDDDDDDDDDDVGRVVSYNLRSIISHLKPTTVITIHQLIFSLDFDDHDGQLIFSFYLEDDEDNKQSTDVRRTVVLKVDWLCWDISFGRGKVLSTVQHTVPITVLI